ncbi:T9SS type A sorting domain-containing protein [bacterium]|nr:T9SS type A sorting domain-containing protein [bacterium]
MIFRLQIRIIVLLLLISANVVQARNQWIGLEDQPSNKPSVIIHNNELSAIELEFNLPGYYQSEIDIEGVPHLLISAPEMTPILKAGAPDLPKYYRSVIIPDDAHMRLTVEVIAFQDIPLENLVPSKGNLSRTINPASVQFQFGEEYQNDAFYPEQIATLSDPYVMRDLRGAVVQIHPFRYNPISGILRVYTHLRLNLEADGPAQKGIKSRSTTSVHRGFLPVYKNHFINFDPFSIFYDLPVEIGNMLIITADGFYDAVLPLVDWKQTRGLSTEIIAVSEIGNNASAILNAVQARYSSLEGLTFLLIVGDGPDVVPAISSGAASDPSYALLDGGNGDQYPDIFVGRLSASTVSQVETQVAKIIDYEANPDPFGDWYQKAMGLASAEGAGIGDDGEADIEHMDNIRTDLLGYGYDPVDQIYDPSASVSMVSSGVNEGRGLINYVGHGSTNAWSTTGFSSSNVASLNNTGKLPVIVSVACVNGNFQSTTCFAEAWLRAGTAGDQRGAVAMYASTINQSWAPPMCAQDEFVDLLAADAHMTIGALMFSGSAQMIDEYGTGGFEMYATWHIFGDPSMPMRTRIPETVSGVTTPDVLILGSSQIEVSAGEINNAVVSLSKHGELLATAPLSAFGTTTLTFEPLTEVDTCMLIITGQNLIPWQAELLIISPAGPWLVVEGFEISDGVDGNGNGILDFGESVEMDIQIHNVGADVCETVNCLISLEDEYVTLGEDFINSGPLAADEVFAQGPFELIISDAAPDGHGVVVSILMDNGVDFWDSEIVLTLNAPSIILDYVTVLDAGNGRLDIGESADLELCLNNLGGSGLTSANISLSSGNPFVASLGPVTTLDGFAAGSLDFCSFSIDLEYATPPGQEIEFEWSLEGDLGYTAGGTFTLVAGLVVEDFESADFDAFDWLFAGHQNWVIDNSEFYEGQYSARSGNINNSQNSEMSLFIDVDDDAILRFNYMVSSEAGSDGLQFLIDGAEMANWQGEIPWNEANYILSGGAHELTWKYSKNFSGSSGSDCAWIDFIVLPLSEVPGSIIGDVTADAQINVQDIIRLVNIILGQGAVAQEYELFCADVNGDGEIDIGDLVLLVDIIMGDHLGRFTMVETLEARLSDNMLFLASDARILAIDLSYQGLLAADLDGYHLVQISSEGVTRVVIYALDAAKAAAQLRLGQVNSDFKILKLQVAFAGGQVLTVDVGRLGLPEQFLVYPNFPNPFNPRTTISYDLPRAGVVSVQIFDIQGREIETLQNAPQAAGHYELSWDGAASDGRNIESGLYFCRIISGDNTVVLKLMLMK